MPCDPAIHRVPLDWHLGMGACSPVAHRGGRAGSKDKSPRRWPPAAQSQLRACLAGGGIVARHISGQASGGVFWRSLHTLSGVGERGCRRQVMDSGCNRTAVRPHGGSGRMGRAVRPLGSGRKTIAVMSCHLDNWHLTPGFRDDSIGPWHARCAPNGRAGGITAPPAAMNARTSSVMTQTISIFSSAGYAGYRPPLARVWRQPLARLWV